MIEVGILSKHVVSELLEHVEELIPHCAVVLVDGEDVGGGFAIAVAIAVTVTVAVVFIFVVVAFVGREDAGFEGDEETRALGEDEEAAVLSVFEKISSQHVTEELEKGWMKRWK